MNGRTRNVFPTLLAADRRRVAIVTETYAPEVNGVARSLARFVDGLRALGHGVTLIRPRQMHIDDGPADPRVMTVRGMPLPVYRGLQFGLPATRRIVRAWRDERPDVVYIATEGPLGLSAVRAARQLGIPAVSGFHTNFPAYARHYGIGALSPAITRYLCWFHNQTACTLVPSLELQTYVRALGVERVGTLGRGVDGHVFSPAHRCPALRRAWCASDDVQVVLYVGRVAPEKNVRLVIAAYRAMQRANRAVRLIIVGDGPSRRGLERRHPDVIFSGPRGGIDLSRHYASADVFLFPSETDTFGNVTLEAMASGLAVVAYDYAAARMHIRHRESGLLVELGDARGFIDGAVTMAKMPRQLHRLRERARDHAASIDWRRVSLDFSRLLFDAANLQDRQAFGFADQTRHGGSEVADLTEGTRLGWSQTSLR